ncbi:MAG: polysaccharide pyruvyl transferase family protein [Pseudomonadota bacterium]
MKKSQNTACIGLVWHSLNSSNLGVGALTLANIAIVREAARSIGITPKFIVLGWSDSNPYYIEQDDVQVVELRLKDFAKPTGGLYSKLRSCDIVLDIGAGDSFSDIYGLKRFGTILGSKVLTILARRPLILSPQTIGPFERAWVQSLALMVMKRAKFVASRDDLSTKFLRDIGFERDIVEASDVALRLPFNSPKPVANTNTIAKKVKIGLNVSGLLFNGGYSRKNMFGLRAPYAECIRDLLRWTTATSEYEVHLVPHVISDCHEVEDDFRINQKLALEFPNVIQAPRFSTPIEAKSYIANMNFFVGARMHACIAAFSSGVPVLPMAYSRKFSGLFASMGYDVIADCKEDSKEQIIAKFRQSLENREDLRLQTEISLKRGLKRLGVYEDAISDCLKNLQA